MKQAFLFICLICIISACTSQPKPTKTPPPAFAARELPSITPSPPPTATSIPTNTPTSTNTPTTTPTNTPTATPTITPIPECIGASPTQLSVGSRARIINYQLNVRSGPDTQHPVINRLSIGREVTIVDGSQCSDGQLWYYIITDEFTNNAGAKVYVEGWSIEESGDVYFLEPID